jgi:hypothetical protein
MLLFNVTIIVEEPSANDFITWMKEDHIPALMEKECFVSHRLFKILDSPNEGITYSVQFIADSEADFNTFREKFEHEFTAHIYTRYPEKLVVFSTLMEFIS